MNDYNEKTVDRLRSLSSAFDLRIEDREAISTAIEAIRERNKTIYIVSLLEALTKEGYGTQLFEYVIWKLVCKYLSYILPKERKQACIEECIKEIEKWVK